MEKKKFVVPHVYILLLALILVFSLLSYVIPSNVYDYHDVVVNPETGQTRSVVDPETYHAVDPTPVSLMQFLTAVRIDAVRIFHVREIDDAKTAVLW